MEKIFVCPKCQNLRSLIKCNSCNYKIEYDNGIFNFLLNNNDKVDFDYIGFNYYEDKESLIQEEIARVISEIIKDGIILDLGCGDGALVIPLLKYDFKLIGMDTSIVMLNKLSKKLDGKYDNLTLIKANAEEIPLKDESVDLVIANNLLHLVDSPKTVLKEILRVLKQDGLFIQISDSNENSYIEMGTEINKYKEITSYYFNKYWELMRDINYYPNKYDSSFNIFLEAKKLFKDVYTIKSNYLEYKGIKTIKDFIEKEKSKSDYTKLHIPSSIHKYVFEEIQIKLEEKYGRNYQDIFIKFEGSCTNIIDIYKK